MALKKSKRRLSAGSNDAEHKKRKHALLAAQLAPVEEIPDTGFGLEENRPTAESDLLAPGEDFVDGSVILDGDHIAIPRQIIHPDGDDRSYRVHPVFVVVVAVALSYAACMAYLIHLEPQ